MNIIRALPFVGLVVIFSSIIACTSDLLTKRVYELYHVMYTSGSEIETREWLLASEEKLAYLEAFGGLTKMSKERYEFAQTKNGVKNIQVEVIVPDENNESVVEITIIFNNGYEMSKQELWKHDKNQWMLFDVENNDNEKNRYGVWKVIKEVDGNNKRE